MRLRSALRSAHSMAGVSCLELDFFVCNPCAGTRLNSPKVVLHIGHSYACMLCVGMVYFVRSGAYPVCVG